MHGHTEDVNARSITVFIDRKEFKATVDTPPERARSRGQKVNATRLRIHR